MKYEILSWLDAIAFAVVVVFLINQFLFQLFVIPSPSMQDTLMVGDRVVVSKMAYGLELYPYGPKILDSREPDRDEIITFYNPEYESRGPVFSILSKVVYMASFGFVNLEVDENGNPGEWLYVKRTAGKSGDTVTFRDGQAYVKLSGTGSYVNEKTFREENLYSTAPKREIKAETYVPYLALGRLNGITSKLSNRTIGYPSHLISDYSQMDENAFYTDYYCYDLSYSDGMRMADPTDMAARSENTRLRLGVYVPEGYILPLGDNRDNSTDGRYFGPVKVSDVTGMVTNIFWPVSRASSVVSYFGK